jgi:hypothetical protein
LLLGELVFVAEVRNEDLALAVFAKHVMSDAVRFCRRAGSASLIVHCPLKCIVTSHWFSASNTGISASRPSSSSVAGLLAPFM